MQYQQEKKLLGWISSRRNNLHVLYIIDAFSVHDRRIIEKFLEWRFDVSCLGLGPRRDLHWLHQPGVEYLHWRGDELTVKNEASLDEVAPALRTIVNHIRPDAIHAGPIHTAGYLAAQLSGLPTLYVSWGYDVLLPEAHHGDWGGRVATVLRSAKNVFCDSDAVRLDLEQRVGNSERLQFVQFPWGTDLTLYRPNARYDVSPNEIRIACARSWEPIYGVLEVLTAFYRARTTEPRLRLILGGGGSLAGAIGEYVRTHGLQDCVEFAGVQDEVGMSMLLSSSDLYISCSQTDGASVSLLEAMASGLPVVVSDIIGNREWVDATGGRLVPCDEPVAIASAILEIIRLHPHERLRMGSRNRELVEARADWPVNVLALRRFYERITRVSHA